MFIAILAVFLRYKIFFVWNFYAVQPKMLDQRTKKK